MAAKAGLGSAPGRSLVCFALLIAWQTVAGEIRYSIPEEMQKGSFVGNLLKDLGLDLQELPDSGVRIVSTGRTPYFALNLKSGHLIATERMDREQICGQLERCLLHLEVLVEDKVRLVIVDVEITDINDNAPRFQEAQFEFRISELTAVGTRYPLEEAQDPDVGTNSLQGYQLSSNEHFSLEAQAGADADGHLDLVLQKPLDREERAVHDLILTATDGGDPVRSGTARVRVVVLDANDNAPAFSQPVYTVSVLENVPVGSLLLTVNATDPDEAMHSALTYSLRKLKDKASQVFRVDARTGEISTAGNLDYEEAASYEMEVQAKDSGDLSARSKVLVTVIDVNDNVPTITMTSLFSSVREDSPPGTLIALLNIRDEDSGRNGEVTCSIAANLPFRLQKTLDNYYSLVTDRALDRERVSGYNVTVTATDRGTPPLSSTTSISVQLSDINDNAPIFSQTSYTVSIPENNPSGASVCSVRATDRDWGENARVTYSLLEGEGREAPLSSAVSINSETGAVYALRSFDYEQLRELRFRVQARDGGSPPPPLVARRLRRWRESQLLDSSSGTFSGVPVSHFVGIDGVRAFLHSYSQEASLTAGSRKKQPSFPNVSCSNTLTGQNSSEKLGPLLVGDLSNIDTVDQVSLQLFQARWTNECKGSDAFPSPALYLPPGFDIIVRAEVLQQRLTVSLLANAVRR
nr:protocadherin gamma-A1 [Pelodiscus sinensis]|eukprot:XP_014427795.1 protocadherin gamma-A1 [Pelodiscus sinensis]